MIDFKYEIVRDDNDKLEHYSPDLYKSPIASTSYIEGPNTSGKSTLLHLIAYGFYGLEEKDIPDSLKIKMKDLIDEDEVTFDIKIKDDEGRTIIQAKKSGENSKEIDTFHLENGNKVRMTSDSFRRNYKLLYDIPEQANERIQEIARDVDNYQSDILNHISSYQSYLRSLVADINEAKDEHRIKALKKQIEGQQSTLNDEKRRVNADKIELKLMRHYTYTKFLEEAKKTAANLRVELDRIVTKTRGKKKKTTSDKSAYTKANNIAGTLVAAMRNNYNNTTTLLKLLLTNGDDKTLLKNTWLNINFDKIQLDHEFPPMFGEILEEFKEKSSLIHGEFKDVQETTEIYESLIQTLKDATRKKIPMPQIEIDSFILAIEDLNRKNKTKATISKNAEEAWEYINIIKQQRNTLIHDHFPKLREFKKNSGKKDTDQEEDDRSSEYALQLKKADTDIKNYEIKCNKLDIDEDSYYQLERDHSAEIEQFRHSTENQLLEEIKNLEDSYIKGNDKIATLEFLIKKNAETVERLERQEPHKFEKQKEQIDDIKNIVDSIWRHFHTSFRIMLKQYRNKEKLPNKSSRPKEYESTKKYYDNISLYLGQRLGKIRYQQDVYEVKKVDFTSGTITTTGEKTIRLAQISTGQSQSAYLKTILGADYGNKKLIVMFDEVGMMDKKSMEPIFTKFKEMKKNGKLLVGLVVQRRDKGPRITQI